MTAYKAARHRPHHATTGLAPLSALCLTIPDRRPSTPGARLVPGASPVTSQREGEYKWAQQQPRRHAVAAHCCQRGRRRQRRRRQRCLRRDLLAAVCGRLALSGRGGERRSVRDAAPFVTRATFSLVGSELRTAGQTRRQSAEPVLLPCYCIILCYLRPCGIFDDRFFSEVVPNTAVHTILDL